MTRSNPFADLPLCTSMEYNSGTTNGSESGAATLRLCFFTTFAIMSSSFLLVNKKICGLLRIIC